VYTRGLKCFIRHVEDEYLALIRKIDIIIPLYIEDDDEWDIPLPLFVRRASWIFRTSDLHIVSRLLVQHFSGLKSLAIDLLGLGTGLTQSCIIEIEGGLRILMSHPSVEEMLVQKTGYTGDYFSRDFSLKKAVKRLLRDCKPSMKVMIFKNKWDWENRKIVRSVNGPLLPAEPRTNPARRIANKARSKMKRRSSEG